MVYLEVQILFCMLKLFSNLINIFFEEEEEELENLVDDEKLEIDIEMRRNQKYRYYLEGSYENCNKYMRF